MNGPLEGAVELLEHSLAYTRVALSTVRPDQLDRATPCAGWSLGQLLAHMEDALDAFTEAASGRVAVDPLPPLETRVEALREKACALLGAWTRAARGPVDVAGVGLDAPVLVVTAALEITLHGWDVAQATGRRTPVPEDLAAGLLGLARVLIGEADRAGRFAPARPVAVDASAGARLLAWSGRPCPVGETSSPAPADRREPRTGPGLAS